MEARILEIKGRKFYILAKGVPQEIPGGYILPPGKITLVNPFEPVGFLRHGWHSWSPTWWVREGDDGWLKNVPESRRPLIDDPAYFSIWPWSGSGLGALEEGGERIVLLGALGTGCRVEYKHNVLWGWTEDGTSPWFIGYGREEEVFRTYGSLLGQYLGSGGGGSSPRVWCSWYSYYREIDESLLLRTLADLSQFPIDVFQVDDGWQRDIGDWEANERFPQGMAYIARKIKGRGFKPGIWVAPFIVRPTSHLFRTHPEWVLKDERQEPVLAGVNWGGPFYSLDLSHSGVIKWLEELFSTIQSWGYEYFKLDFLYAGALPGVHSSPGAREEIYRRALSVIRKALGEAYILACGAPIIPSLGIADGIRIGPDVAPYWDTQRYEPGTRNAIRCSIHRLWLQSVIHTDPDVIFFRTKYNLLTTAQRRLLRDLGWIARFKATSDPPEWLDDQELQEMRMFFTEQPTCKRLSRYLYTVGDWETSFSDLERF